MVHLSRSPGSLGWWVRRSIDGVLLYVLGYAASTCLTILVETLLISGPLSVGMQVALPWIVSGIAAVLLVVLVAAGLPVTRR